MSEETIEAGWMIKGSYGRERNAARRGDRGGRRRNDGGDLRGLQRRGDAAPRAHRRRRAQDPDQRRRPMQRPADGGRRVPLGNPILAAHPAQDGPRPAPRGAGTLLAGPWGYA